MRQPPGGSGEPRFPRAGGRAEPEMEPRDEEEEEQPLAEQPLAEQLLAEQPLAEAGRRLWRPGARRRGQRRKAGTACKRALLYVCGYTGV